MDEPRIRGCTLQLGEVCDCSLREGVESGYIDPAQLDNPQHY